MTKHAIRIEKLSKRYRIGKVVSQPERKTPSSLKLTDPFRYLFDSLREPSADEIV